jgi:polar amino acid transport system permease protein
MDAILHNFFNLDIYAQVFPYLLQGLWATVWLSLLVIPAGVVAGLGVALLSTQARSRGVRIAVALYVDLFRAFPPLVLLIFIYYGAPFIGLDLPKLAAVLIGFVLNNASYYGEVFRAGIDSIPKGQMEAAYSTGLTRAQALRYVVIPQATRNVMPDLIGNSIEVVKLTTLASVVALPELLRVSRDAQALLYNPSPIVLAALLYLALLWPLVRVVALLERRSRAAR